jgi:hypothetical protein
MFGRQSFVMLAAIDLGPLDFAWVARQDVIDI